MQISKEGDLPVSTDFEQISHLVPLDGARLLELGCGAAEVTTQLATRTLVREIVAMEVDQIQHGKNLLVTGMPKVDFRYGGAAEIDLPDASVDAVLMLKSLHHVPLQEMDQALREIARVLRPGGLVYLSEPVYAGAFNEILRLFHDEKQVRTAAFEAIQRAIDASLFELQEEVHFVVERGFENFAAFEERIFGVTHTDFQISEAIHAEIREKFAAQAAADGSVLFRQPVRVDLLRKV